MYLESVKIQNFRKFGSENNIISFASNYSKSDDKVLNSTLIVGQNNAGKTSVIKALQKASGDEKEKFQFTDFNYYYLGKLLSTALENKDRIKTYIDEPNSASEELLDFVLSLIPFISLTFNIYVNLAEDSEDLLTNIGSIITNDIPNNGIVSCILKYETENYLSFIKELNTIINKPDDLDTMFASFLELLNSFSDEFSTNCYIGTTDFIKTDFKIKNLFNINIVSFEKLHTPSRLTEAFNKIYRYKVNKDDDTKNKFDESIKEINNKIDETIKTGSEISKSFNNVLSQTTDSTKVSMELKANLDLDTLLNNVVKYVYKDGRFEIPEDQFGMGYTNLMLIISELFDYIDDTPENEFFNKINLLVIEEPESYMHPQMQKVLIENINSAFLEIIKAKSCSNDKVNCQMIITSHSPFVLSGKISVEDTFNNVNYIKMKQSACSSIVPLRDNNISSLGSDDFEFLKRYIKFKCCELFFADAAIFIEGLAEETILPYFLAKDEQLNKKYISFFNINGSYFHIYENLIKTLGIPVVILTDLDLIDSEKSKTNDQVSTLKDRTTMNQTLIHFSFDILNESQKTIDNIFISTQSMCEGFYPTSFEEAIILANPTNELIKEVLKDIHPEKYKNIDNSLAKKSHETLNNLSKNKGRFAAALLYKMVNNKNKKNELSLPQYIIDGLNYIKKELGINGANENNEQSA